MPRLPIRGAHLAVLWALAFVLPLLEIVGEEPAFFIARGNTRSDVLAFTLGLALLPPLAMVALELAAAKLSERAGRVLHLGFVGLLSAALALQIVNDLAAAPAGVLIAAGLIAGAGIAIAYDRVEPLRQMLTVLSPVPLLIVAIFLLFSHARGVVLPSTEASESTAELPADPPPVVFVVFDELPTTSLMNVERRIDRSLYPRIAELADQATWYRNATTIADLTPRAVGAILTGRDPGSGTLPTAAEQPENLFTALSDDYRIEAFEDVTRLCPESLCEPRNVGGFGSRVESLVSDLSIVSGRLLLPESLAEGLPPVDASFRDFRGGDVDDLPRQAGADASPSSAGGRPAQTEEFLDSIEPRRGGSPPFYFLHVQLPHQPWQYLPTGQSYFTGDARLQDFVGALGRWTSQDWLVEHMHQRHLLQLGDTDRFVGRLIDRLRRADLWNGALIVVTADHGIGFAPDVLRRQVQLANVDEVAPVPLLIKAPGQRRGRIDDRAVRTTDVLPTVADLIGAELSFETTGRSVLGRIAPEPVSVADRSGHLVSIPLAELVARERRRLAVRTGLFGSDQGWPRVYRFGDEHGLIGRRAPRPEGDAEDAELAGPENFVEIDPAGPVLPTLIRARIPSSFKSDTPIAVAVNGRIAAVGRSYETGGEDHIGLMIPPGVLRRRSNSIEILRIGAGGRLIPLGTG